MKTVKELKVGDVCYFLKERGFASHELHRTKVKTIERKENFGGFKVIYYIKFTNGDYLPYEEPNKTLHESVFDRTRYFYSKEALNKYCDERITEYSSFKVKNRKYGRDI